MVRYKNRYFVTELELRDRPPHAPISITNNRLRNCIFNKVGEIHGDFGVAAITTGFRIKYCNPCTKIVLIRCRHGPHRIVGTVLPLIKVVDDHKVQFNLLHVGSTIKKSFKFIRNHQLRTLETYWNKMKTDKDRMQIKDLINDIDIMTEFNKSQKEDN